MIFCKYKCTFTLCLFQTQFFPDSSFCCQDLNLFSVISYFMENMDSATSHQHIPQCQLLLLIMISFYHDFVRITISRFSIFRLSFRIFSRNLGYHSHQALYCKPNNSFSVFKTMLYQGSIVTLLLYFYLFI